MTALKWFAGAMAVTVLSIAVCPAQEMKSEPTEDQSPPAVSNIHYAIQIDDIDSVRKLIDKNPSLVSLKDERGYTPLLMASLLRHTEIAGLLIDAGADVEQIDDDGITLLYKMVVAGHREMAELLLDKGASPEVKDRTGNPLLTVSIMNDKRKMAELLLNKGADINAGNNEGNTALHLAQKPELIDLLLLNGADIEAKNNEGQRPLHMTCRKKGDLLAAAEILVANGADVNSPDNEGRSPIHYAVEHKLKEYVILFLQNDPDIYLEDEDGISPLELAQQVGKRSITVRLEAHDRKLKRAEKLAELKEKLSKLPKY